MATSRPTTTIWSIRSAAARPGDALRRIADDEAEGSFANAQRSRRFQTFARLIDALADQHRRPVQILDIGGTNAFWEQRGWAGRQTARLTLVNLEPEQRLHPNIEAQVGDATDLSQFASGTFDVVFSNSVIEHLATFDRQAAMAAEVRRLAPRYWIQTPNFWFPIEPHFLTPGWHWLPKSARIALLRRRRWGWRGPCPDPELARALVSEIRLMRRSELMKLFPDATLEEERIGPLVKSFIAARVEAAPGD